MHTSLLNFQPTHDSNMDPHKKPLKVPVSRGILLFFIPFLEHRSHRGWFGEGYKAAIPFCWEEPGSALSVFDANGDGYDDLTCHTPKGLVQITESHIVAAHSAGDYTSFAAGK